MFFLVKVQQSTETSAAIKAAARNEAYNLVYDVFVPSCTPYPLNASAQECHHGSFAAIHHSATQKALRPVLSHLMVKYGEVLVSAMRKDIQDSHEQLFATVMNLARLCLEHSVEMLQQNLATSTAASAFVSVQESISPATPNHTRDLALHTGHRTRCGTCSSAAARHGRTRVTCLWRCSRQCA